MRLSRLLAVAIAAAGFAAIAPSAHAADYFLKVDGIKGETLNQSMPGYTDIDSFDFSLEQTASLSATGISAGKAKFNEVTITKPVDALTPQLLPKAAAGQVFGAIEVVGRKAPGTTFVRYCFQKAMITKQEQAGDADAATEKLSFSYAMLGQQFTRQNNDGTQGATAFGGWNLLTNQLIPGTQSQPSATCSVA